MKMLLHLYNNWKPCTKCNKGKQSRPSMTSKLCTSWQAEITGKQEGHGGGGGVTFTMDRGNSDALYMNY